MTTCICTVGYPGAGKTAAQTPAEDRDIPIVVMGDRVRERALEAIPDDELAAAEDSDVTDAPSKSDLIGEWATEQRDKHGDAVVAQWTVEYIQSEADTERVFVDGMRSLAEKEVFEDAFEEAVVLYVAAPFDTRLQRLQNRGRDGEEAFTAEDLRERDAREDEWGVAEVVEAADERVTNDGSLSEFHDAVGAILDEY